MPVGIYKLSFEKFLFMKNVSKTMLWGIGIISGGTILFEICLTRIFSVTLWFYFGFFAISLAMLGTAAAAIWCSLFLRNCTEGEYKHYLSLSSLLFALFAPLSIFVHLNLYLGRYLITSVQFYLILGIQLLFFIGVFFFSGMSISIILCAYHREIGKIYCFNLMGAALGSFIVVPLMYYFSPLALVFFVMAMALLGCLLFNIDTALRKIIGFLILVSLLLFWTNDRGGILKINFVKGDNNQIIQSQSKERRYIFEKWSPVSRVTVFPSKKTKRDKNIKSMRVTIDAGARTILIHVDRRSQRLKYFKHWRHMAQIVQQLKTNADVLVIGIGGGQEVLDSLAFDQHSITAVEINPVMVDLVTKYFKDYIGRIFDDPRVRLYIQDGRNFVAGSKNKHDIILMNMVDSWGGVAAGGYIFDENTLYTKEAVADYYSHLKPDGILSITRRYDDDQTLRLNNMIIETLENNGIQDIDKRIIVLHEKGSRNYAVSLVKNGLFNSEEVEHLLKQSKKGLYDIVYAPYLEKKDMDPSRYASFFHRVISPERYSKKSREAFVNSYPNNITASSDDKPFFFFMTRFKDSFRISSKEHFILSIAIPILYVTFLMVNVFSFFLIILPLKWKKEKGSEKIFFPIKVLGYFGAIGVGYMLMEVSLIQRLTVFLGHPIYAFVVVLSGLLCSNGIGSLVSQRWGAYRNILLGILLGVIGLGLFIGLLIYNQFVGWMGFSKLYRILMAIGTIMPIGFLMGMCLPLGMRIIRRFGERCILWAWGINGAFSVLGSTLSLILALNWGLKATFLTGVMCYLLAAVLIVSLRDDSYDLRILR